jgi:hypothetical protein
VCKTRLCINELIHPYELTARIIARAGQQGGGVAEEHFQDLAINNTTTCGNFAADKRLSKAEML